MRASVFLASIRCSLCSLKPPVRAAPLRRPGTSSSGKFSSTAVNNMHIGHRIATYDSLMKTTRKNVNWREQECAKRARGRAQLFEFRALARGKCLAIRSFTEGHARAHENSRLGRNPPARPEVAGTHAHNVFQLWPSGPFEGADVSAFSFSLSALPFRTPRSFLRPIISPKVSTND